MKKDPRNVRNANLKVSLLFGAMALVLAGGLAASFFAGHAAFDAMNRITQFDSAIERLQDLRSTMQDAETGQRGYLLTREANYLQPYEGALVVVRKELETVQKMAEIGLLHGEQVSELERLIGKKIDELRKTVDLVRAGRASAALEIVRGDEGKRLMDSIRDTISAISSQQVDGRTSAKQAADSAVELRGRVFLASVIINLGFLVWAYRRIRCVQQSQGQISSHPFSRAAYAAHAGFGDTFLLGGDS